MKSQVLHVEIDEMEFAYLTGKTFRGMTISAGDPWWNIVIRARARDGEPIYCMTQAPEIGDGFNGLVDALSGKGGESLWRHDKYAR